MGVSRKQRRKTKDLGPKTPSESQKQRRKTPLNMKKEEMRLNQHVRFLKFKIVCLSRFDSCSIDESSIYPFRPCHTLTVPGL